MAQIDPRKGGSRPSYSYQKKNPSDFVDEQQSFWNTSYNVDSSNLFMDSFLGQWLFPGLQQKEEFEQQKQLQAAQNEWNSEQEKMKRLQEAGINSNLAAQGVAGAGNAPGVSAPNSAAGTGAAGMQAASGAVDAGMNAYEKVATTPSIVEKYKAETVQMLEAAGLNHWEALAISEMLPLQKDNMRADTYLKIANFNNVQEEYHNIVLEHDKRKAEIDEIQKQAAMYEKQGNLAEAMKLKVEAETKGQELDNWFKTTRKQCWIDNGYDPNNPPDMALINAHVNGKLGVASVIGDSIEKFSYKTQYGSLDALAEFQPYFDILDDIKTLYQETVKNNAKDPNLEQIIGRAVRKLMETPSNNEMFKNLDELRIKLKPKVSK